MLIVMLMLMLVLLLLLLVMIITQMLCIAIAFDADIANVVLATDDGDVGDDGDDVHEAKWAGGQPLSQQQDLADQTTTSTITG